ncbi:hypothetical protein [Dactylosporangium salmoneum]|uniref:Uncharacterized protein n=1 Tax=Dactylosporangium salmoneum TaxID=53361 RepID=A0ABP5TAZ2_9ACTN
MLVTIVAVPNADNTGLDVERMEKVEDLAPELALKMLEGGTARQPSEAELAAYHEQQQAGRTDDAEGASQTRTSRRQASTTADGADKA